MVKYYGLSIPFRWREIEYHCVHNCHTDLTAVERLESVNKQCDSYIVHAIKQSIAL